MAICPPNYTQIPNDILDRMHEMTPAEFKVLMAIARKTFGWQKAADVMSVSQLATTTGMSKASVQTGLTAALARGLAVRVKVGAQSFAYSLLVGTHDEPNQPTIPKTSTVEPTIPKTSTVPYQNLVQQPYQNLVTQKKELKKDLKKDDDDDDGATEFFVDHGDGDGGPDEVGEGEYASVAELIFDELLDLGLYPDQAAQVVEGETVKTSEDVAQCQRYIDSLPQTVRAPAGMLWSKWLSRGRLPMVPVPRARPAEPEQPRRPRDLLIDGPEPATATDEQKAVARQLREMSDLKNPDGGEYVGYKQLAAVIAGASLKGIPAPQPGDYWKGKPA